MVGILKREDAAIRLGMSASTLDRRVNPKDQHYDPDFPKPIRDGTGRLLGYNVEDIDRWRGVSPSLPQASSEDLAKNIAQHLAVLLASEEKEIPRTYKTLPTRATLNPLRMLAPNTPDPSKCWLAVAMPGHEMGELRLYLDDDQAGDLLKQLTGSQLTLA